MKTITVPNILTFARILGVPLFAVAYVTDHTGIAAVIFVVAIITDVLDGVIARMKKTRTILGSILDPLADKILINVALLLLASSRLVPYWVVTVILSKDAILVLGWLLVYIMTSNTRVEPSIFGKLANFFESILVIVLLISPFFNPAPEFLKLVIHGTTIATVVIAGFALIDYTWKGIKRLG